MRAMARRPRPSRRCSSTVLALRVLTHEQILAQVWGQEYIDDVDYLKVYIRRLRNKIGDDPQNTELIHAERGVGYIFQVRPKADISSAAPMLLAV